MATVVRTWGSSPRPEGAMLAIGDDELVRLHGPVGRYIGSRTPPEIAISILAEVTAAKNGVSLPTMRQVEGAKAARASNVRGVSSKKGKLNAGARPR